MYKTTGILRYYHTTCNLLLCKDLAHYYRALCPKAWNLKPPKEQTHISVVRAFEESNREFWDRYQDEVIEIKYWLPVETDGIYYWLNADSDRLAEIRLELGLPRYRGNFISHHFTIGNLK